MKTVVAVYTGQGLDEMVKKAFAQHLPNQRLVNIIDDSLIYDVVKAGEVTASVKKRLLQYYQHAVDMGADAILNTCSSVGEVADIARALIDTPIIKIDEQMAQEAVEHYQTIGVLATLPTTLQPTMRLIERQAANSGRKVQLIDGLAEGAYAALVSGRPEEHDRLLLATARHVAQKADVLVLAQGSMARMEDTLSQETGRPVLSSPVRGIQELKRVVTEGKRRR
ncbi:hypothetical protein GCM10011391_34520 [Pullulanibacillus camelliae]|uniref:Asp/Glu/hydantoin racemase n=1 Tax=Pullulanibacillus camelliae TaxID=1707096 RepID=A0A8J3DY49_9BACL|nr:aspartate/glutamate racemase family protein [Pullulanibacillus camelliae]GGE52767.1 hypothetical protein GCM10011391_34520 [Pullulanibacillus camelliae]